MSALAATWGIVALATGGVILRPWRLPEAIWAVTGAAILVLAGLLSLADAWRGVLKGTDVYLFLIGMMLLAEVARREGLFDWLAARAANLANGSATRLFTLVYVVGTVVTTFMSNDATAVVLTPAVAAVARAAKAEKPLPYLLICAFIANAASFVLPISNPANLVIYGSHTPSLLEWLPRYAAPSLLSIAATYVVLRLTQRRMLNQTIAAEVEVPALSLSGRAAGIGIVVTAVVLMMASALGWQLGLPTCIAGLATAASVVLLERRAPWDILRDISWGVLPLVAGLFVLVEALDRTGVIGLLSTALRAGASWSLLDTAWANGVVIAFASNIMNNLPAGLIAGTAIQGAQSPPLVTGAALIGVDLGPNLSVTGSLLWLAALRREGLRVSGMSFLKIGLLVMPPALVLAIAALVLGG
ncbi:arsenic transporter [Beijerinckia indica]|uniref:Arsenical pump membrane protein n=1 Tax=Beijerinckia indica subsp. indica (strain ATCC 9039 / DSM 1715 / NCIMB 8712) TaxID=395963 RepID=B2IL25_BEII9|nr:Arsenical pump membrane protein [Beijerinckia indica subsp. indica ATCC 9039]